MMTSLIYFAGLFMLQSTYFAGLFMLQSVTIIAHLCLVFDPFLRYAILQSLPVFKSVLYMYFVVVKQIMLPVYV